MEELEATLETAGESITAQIQCIADYYDVGVELKVTKCFVGTDKPVYSVNVSAIVGGSK